MASPSAETVTLNLDEWDDEKGSDAGPFAFVHASRRIVLKNVQDLPWQETTNLDDPYTFFTIVAEKREDIEFCIDNPMPLRKLEKLMSSYRRHYGLGSPGKSPASRG